MPFIYTQLIEDTFQRANENPLNPANWTTMGNTPGFGQGSPLAVVSDVCTSPNAPSTGAGQAYYTSVSLPNNQYVETTLSQMSVNGYMGVYARTGASGGGYLFQTASGSLGGSCVLQLFNSVTLNQLGTNYTSVLNVGDILRLECFGTDIYAKINGVVVIGPITDSTTASGASGLNVSPLSVLSDASVSHFAAGSITLPPSYYSAPDCRAVTTTTPNSSRDVQGTLTYDVPKVFSLQYWFDTLFNRTQPLPVDSRTASAPTDSRTADNIPTNSRTPGTYGPGE